MSLPTLDSPRFGNQCYLGEQVDLGGKDFETVIAWGHVEATAFGREWPRWCILTLLGVMDRIPNQKNYAVTMIYPHDIPPNSQYIESRNFFPNIVPAVEFYCESGMDW